MNLYNLNISCTNPCNFHFLFALQCIDFDFNFFEYTVNPKKKIQNSKFSQHSGCITLKFTFGLSIRQNFIPHSSPQWTVWVRQQRSTALSVKTSMWQTRTLWPLQNVQVCITAPSVVTLSLHKVFFLRKICPTVLQGLRILSCLLAVPFGTSNRSSTAIILLHFTMFCESSTCASTCARGTYKTG